MTSEASVRKAIPKDFTAITKLLREVGLPTSDVSTDLSHFFVIEEDGEIIASAGLEVYDNLGLLRSVAVDKNHRNRSLAMVLVNKLLSYAAGEKLKALYLITTTAEHYFAKRGFQTVNRDNIPAPITSSSEFSSTCPSTATVMVKEL
ncbi:MAG TPA: arsenic resistance N-acetyltransferase ArsN2 [Flavitalea sp.]|nr:arsenic resistance N-acetyltransferase ArsN2 [Flavitalea sp.]